MKKKIVRISQKSYKTGVSITIVLLMILSSILVSARQPQMKQASSKETDTQDQLVLQSQNIRIGWSQEIGDNGGVYGRGFGSETNVASRGMTIYNNELYVGTQNWHHLKNLDFLTIQSEIITPQEIGIDQSSQVWSSPLIVGDQQENRVPSEDNFFTIPSKQNSISLPTEDQNENPVIRDGCYSPDGGAHFYYLEPEVFGSSELIDYLIDTVGTPLMRVLLYITSSWSDGCEIWKYNYATQIWTQVIGDLPGHAGVTTAGFDYTYNSAVGVMKTFSVDHKLYVGTWSTTLGSLENPLRKGCEVWRYDGTTWEQVVGLDAFNRGGVNGGFGNPDNMGACSIEEFNGALYIGTMNFNFNENGACEVWRSTDGTHWTKVVDHGFRAYMTGEDSDDLTNGVTNTYAWIMKTYAGKLYVGTFNSNRVFGDGPGAGCQLWCSSNGITWMKVHLPNGINEGYSDGFGEWQNYGIRRLETYNGLLCIGTATDAVLPRLFNPHEACEIWTYDGTNGPNAWNCIVGEKANDQHQNDNNYKDGFGNEGNKYAWGMTISNNDLWVGTANENGTGCQVLWYNPSSGWIPSVRTPDGEIGDGFGDPVNSGVRSMIEYPANSGIVFVGTYTRLTVLRNDIGCEIWKHIP
jgi:hypothetical protein